MKVIALSLIVLFSIQVANAQVEKAEKKPSMKAANEKLSSGNYAEALKEFLKLKELDANNYKLDYKIGVCYLNSSIDKSKAVSYLEKAAQYADAEPNASYLLGRAYHYANKFDDAIKAYTAFKKLGKGSQKNLLDVEREIAACYNAKELVKFPINVTFENLGKSVNSQYADQYPFIPSDESVLIFNSKRDNNISGSDGAFFSDVLISNSNNNAWTEAGDLSTLVNTTEGDERITGLSADGNTALFSFDNNTGSEDLFISSKKNGKFEKPTKLSEVINSSSNEIAGCLSIDGTSIIFVSDRSGGYGGTDLYVSKKLPNGNWGPAKNLGASINTPFDEDFPTISADGNTLYFSSKGHTSMGGYDIFKASRSNEEAAWENVLNMGYPLNTAEDNMSLSMSATGRYGYISALRKDCIGDYDIYRVVFNDVEPNYTVIRGQIVSSDPLKKVEGAMITVTNMENEEVYGSYLPNPNTMRYIIILPPGKYNIMTDSDGFKSVSEDITILDKSSIQKYLEKDIKMMSK